MKTTTEAPRIYVAAPYEDAGHVRDLHKRLRSLGFEPSSRWAESSRGPEDFTKYTPLQLRAIAEGNDQDVFDSDVMIVLARAGAGGEMFAEARVALGFGIPVVWVGRRTLSAWRLGVHRVTDIDDGIAKIIVLTSKGLLA